MTKVERIAEVLANARAAEHMSDAQVARAIVDALGLTDDPAPVSADAPAAPKRK